MGGIQIGKHPGISPDCMARQQLSVSSDVSSTCCSDLQASVNVQHVTWTYHNVPRRRP